MINKKILIVSAVFPPEPVVSAAISSDLAESLATTHRVTVISPTPSRPIGYIFSQSNICKKKYEHIILKSFICSKSKIFGRFRESYSFGKACYKFIKNNNEEIDVIYMNTWPLVAQFITARAAVKFNIPIITHIQDIYPESLTNKLLFFKTFFYKVLLPLDKFITQKSSKIIVISTGMYNLLTITRKLPTKKTEIIYNWQDGIKYTPSHKVYENNNDTFIFMFLGSLSPSASIDTTIKAFIDASLENCKLIIAGDGPDKEKLQSITTEYSSSSIEFIEAPIDQVGSLQAKANVLLITLKKGVAKLALPSKLSAYMFSAKPIIASVDAGSDTAHAIEESACGWVVEAESIEDLSQSMKVAFETGRKELAEMGQNGFDYATKHYSKEKNLQKLINVINEFTK